MKAMQVRNLIRIKEEMIERLRTGRRFKQRELAEGIIKDPYWQKNFKIECVYGLVGLAVRVYTTDFYRDPGDNRIALTLSAMKSERDKRRDAELHGRMMGTTAGARIAEAIEAAEG
jgi:hypothetical protein